MKKVQNRIMLNERDLKTINISLELLLEECSEAILNDCVSPEFQALAKMRIEDVTILKEKLKGYIKNE